MVVPAAVLLHAKFTLGKALAMTDFQTDTLDIDQMILDPNNFLFQDAPDFVFAEQKRFAEETVQAKAAARLRDEGLLPLKQSILRNGFLPFERLVVTPYDKDRRRAGTHQAGCP